MFNKYIATNSAGVLALAVIVRGQSACTLTAETHPSLTWQECSADGTCTEVSGSVVVDANWRWTHDKTSSTNCYTGNEWDATLCPDAETCTSNCCIDGADYSSTYGVTTSADSLSLDFVTGANIGSRLYLLANDSSYQGFNLLGNEFTFDVDVSNLPCGLNGALYFVSMDLDGGASAYDNAGAGYGTGYCDSQCPRDLKFITGTANVEGWTPSTNDANSGVGGMGACCAEMDIWEANIVSTALTPHPCSNNAYHSCDGDNCGGTYSSTRYAGDCDPDGCDFNPFRQGNETFYGSGMAVDTDSVITVVTQFVEESGSLSAIKRFYVQNGVVIANSESEVEGVAGYNNITDEYCTSQKTAFGDEDVFSSVGGLAQMGDAMTSPMVLVMSVWDDHYANMLWLDSTYPTDETGAGTGRGTCATSSGVPSDIESSSGSSSVTYSNIKFGPIGSTFDSTGTGSGSSSSASGSSSAASSAAASSTIATSSAASNTAASSLASTAAATSAVAATSDVASTAGETSSSTSAVVSVETSASSSATVITADPSTSDLATLSAAAADATSSVKSTSASASQSSAATGSSTPKKTCKRNNKKLAQN